MGRLKRGRLIKRFDFPAVYRKVVMASNPDDYFDNVVESYEQIKFYVTGSTIQPIKDWEYQQVLQGLSVDQCYSIITETPLTTPVDGSTAIGCSIYIPSRFFMYDAPTGFPEMEKQGGWYRVVQPKNSFNGIQSNCQAYLVKDTVLQDDEGRDKYPLMVAVDALMSTREQLLSGLWKQLYPIT